MTVASCAAGLNGNACVHQAAVSLYFHVDEINVAPVLSLASRLHFAELSLGRERNTPEINPETTNSAMKGEENVPRSGSTSPLSASGSNY